MERKNELAMGVDFISHGKHVLHHRSQLCWPCNPCGSNGCRKKALELLLYGELIKAPEAMELGLVNRIVPKEELETAAYEWAVTLARKNPIAVQIAKKAFYGSEDMGYLSQFDYMNDAFARLCTTSDAKEGVAAFLEKRKPQWQGC